MNGNILTDLSSLSLSRAIRENLYEFFRFLGRSSLTEMNEGPGWLRWRTPIAHAWFNGVICYRQPSEVDTGLVEQTLTFFRSRQAQTITWWCSPDLTPGTWAPFLQPHGFHFDDNTPGMALNLDNLPNPQKQAGERRLPDGVEVLVADDAAAMGTWIEVFSEGYPIPPEWRSDFLTLMVDLGVELPMRNYLGYLDGKPAATSSMFLGAGVAGVYFIATLPVARGRGLGTAMTLAPLYEARQLGYQAGILQSSELGYPVYRRLGFQHLCAVEHFYWLGTD